jgi:hypothetical protein
MSNPNQPPESQPPQQPAVFNVKDYGAGGDGVADDTAAFTSAFAAAPTPRQQIPPKKKSRTLLVGIIAGVLGLGIGGAVGATTSSTTTAGPATTATVTATANHTIYVTSEPTDQPTAGYTPKKSDWKIGIKILTNKCFDTAGASITYRIKPEFVGTVKPPEEGTVEVSYRVSGGEGGPSDNTFTVTGGQMSYDEEEDVDTPSCSTKLKVKVTDVSYTG